MILKFKKLIRIKLIRFTPFLTLSVTIAMGYRNGTFSIVLFKVPHTRQLSKCFDVLLEQIK